MEIRRLKFGANIVVFGMVILVLWGMVNYLNSRHHHRFDLTESKQYSLSPKTIEILRDLKEPVHMTKLYRPGTVLFIQVKDLLEEYSIKSDKVTVEHIDAERDRGKVELLARRLNMDTFELNTVIFECGGKSKHVPESEVIEYDYSYSYGRPSAPKFKGEEAFTSAILAVTQEKQSVLYFVRGHGEKDIEGIDKGDISDAAKLLKRQNFRIEKISILGVKEIPADCDVLSIIGPTKRFSESEMDILNKYVSSGGKCLIMIDPLVDCGLEEFLMWWGVKIGQDVVVDPVRRLIFAGPTTIFTEDYGYHEITRKMRGVAVIFPFARSVEVISGGEFEGGELVKTSGEAWAETNLEEKEAKFDEGRDKKGPVAIGVGVNRKKSAYGESEQGNWRLVVFGDSDFVSNAQLGSVGNADLFLNAVNWLVQREKLISIGPKSPDERKVTLSGKKMRAIFWLVIIGLPAVVILVGLTVWMKRKR